MGFDDDISILTSKRGGTPTNAVEKQTSKEEEDEGPGIENFQIVGDAEPGGTLVGCGFSIRGTSTCNFQWVRYLSDGSKHSIRDATSPEYLVTADDVGKFIALECTPIDDNGRKGDLVRCFANDRKRISSGNGQANFNVYCWSWLVSLYARLFR